MRLAFDGARAAVWQWKRHNPSGHLYPTPIPCTCSSLQFSEGKPSPAEGRPGLVHSPRGIETRASHFLPLSHHAIESFASIILAVFFAEGSNLQQCNAPLATERSQCYTAKSDATGLSNRHTGKARAVFSPDVSLSWQGYKPSSLTSAYSISSNQS